MYFLTSMCFICLKSKTELNAIKAETLTQLLYCVEKGEDFIPLINETRMCNDCLDKLDVAFHFKQMCLNNIVHFKEYVGQYNITVGLTDVNTFEETLEVREFAVLEHEQHSDKQPETVLIKEEILDEINLENNETQMKENIEESCNEELQNQSSEGFNESEKVFIKNEILNEIHSESCESNELQQQYFNEESKLVPLKEENLGDVYDEGEQNHFRKISEHDNSQSEELSKNEGSRKVKLFFICAICEKRFTVKRQLMEHVRIHVKQKPYGCDICQKYFIKKSYLRNHMLIHSNKWSHYCSVCNKGFHFKTRLKRHMVNHINERPYSCSFCMKSFNHKGNLKEHMIVHSDEKPYSCSLCRRSYTQKKSLHNHMLVSHLNERPYSCSVCMKNFTQKSSLYQHKFVHTKERSYSCSECKKSFNRKDSLQRHHLTAHSSERPFCCSICKKSFNRKSILKSHILIHSKSEQTLHD